LSFGRYYAWSIGGELDDDLVGGELNCDVTAGDESGVTEIASFEPNARGVFILSDRCG